VRRRVLVLASVVLVALGAAVVVWAARGDADPKEPVCTRTTSLVPDPTTGKVMTYHETECAPPG
jgi:Flp pilus assembly protein CpaB